MSSNIREIPYNYTSYSDREIIVRFLGEETWDDLNVLRHQRRTGRSARMLFEILGDVWVISRNPYLKHDLLHDRKRLARIQALHRDRLQRIEQGAADNSRAHKVAATTERMLLEFYAWFEKEPARRRKVIKKFAKFTHKNNIHFDAFTLTHSSTDATDWRQHDPFCVLTPDHPDEISGLVRAAAELDLVIIPRGGGTGLSGGSVPLHENSVMINVEKFDHIGTIEMRDVGGDEPVATITAQAGAVTGRVMEASEPYVFATDPTSLWACTIGGNVATNAGGKHALIWGTCVDNLLSWKLVTPDGHCLEVVRKDHNMGRIPHDQPVHFELIRSTADGLPLSKETLIIEGNLFRKDGLGKDVTRKALGGLPGVQKEGTDGFITEATFVLHTPFACTQTVCCEFFGAELSAATESMVSIKKHVDAADGVHLEGLEHFDEKYVKAIDYISKSTRRERPRVVLLIDVSGHDARQVAETCSQITRITSIGGGEGFVATAEADRKRFWADRGRMAAIARHTRAFKLNEDVVIPLDRLAEYNDYVERLNIEHSIGNKLDALDQIEQFLNDFSSKLKSDAAACVATFGIEDDGFLVDKIDKCAQVIESARYRWGHWLNSLDTVAKEVLQIPADVEFQRKDTLFRLMQRGGAPVSYRKEVEAPIFDLLHGYEPLIDGVKQAHTDALSGRIVVATHMHAGDGNVHTNIPVNSNDYVMMQKAHHVVEKVMAKAESLGGVISGEHGIGITKLAYLDRHHLQEVASYLEGVDPDRRFNRGKLALNTDLSLTYTPSFNLLEHEAVLLEAADLTELSEVISPCLRCGKCKPVCNTHFPRTNMLYSPRNKIQASGSMIEAFLYESQSGSGISFEQFSGLQDIADHCTICHKCESPCPVNIDFGEVTERMRALLKDKGQARFNLGSKLALSFLVLQHPDAIHLMRQTIIRWGIAGQRLLHMIGKKLKLVQAVPAAKRNLEGVQAQVINFIERPLPSIPLVTARQQLGIESRDKNSIPILRNPKLANGRAVFYFPGCGSERLFSQVGLATQSMLFELGLNVVLPPSYLCCGYPSTASGDHVRGDEITYENRVLLHRLKNTLSYLDFEAVVVSCGTCYDQLTRYQLEQVFPNAPLIDIHEYLMTQGVQLDGVKGANYIYHEPCHTPLKRHGSAEVIKSLLGEEAVASPQCCGEAGTMAVATPAIAGKIRARKEEEMAVAKAKLVHDEPAKVLTSCPSCLQGLSRLESESGIKADYIVVELARHLHGEDWQQQFTNKVKDGGIEWVLM
ncbi:MAG: FAD/FMN-binding oxidoreductase [Mariprofundaceae bacterium]